MSYCLDRFIERIKDLSYANYDILLIDNSEGKEYFNKLSLVDGVKVLRDKPIEKNPRKKIVDSRNKILSYAWDNNYDYILMMDQDVIPPKDIISELLKDNKDLVSGLYFNYFTSSGKLKVLPVAWAYITPEEFEEIKGKVKLPLSVKKNTDLRRHLTKEETDSNSTIEVMIPSAGCLLIKRNVFEKIRYNLLDLKALGVVDESVRTTDDIGFVLDAKKAEFSSFCNTKIKCDHLVSEKYQKDKDGHFVHTGLKD